MHQRTFPYKSRSDILSIAHEILYSVRACESNYHRVLLIRFSPELVATFKTSFSYGQINLIMMNKFLLSTKTSPFLIIGLFKKEKKKKKER